MSGLDCKSVFAYRYKNAIGFEKHSIWAITLLKQNLFCLSVSLWDLYSDFFFFFGPFSDLVFVCVCSCTSN